MSVEGVAGEPDEFRFVVAEFSGVLELVAKFFDLDYIGEANFAGAICEGEGGGGSGELLPDELQHEQLVEIVVQQRARDGIEFPVVVVGAAGQVDDHGVSTLPQPVPAFGERFPALPQLGPNWP